MVLSEAGEEMSNRVVAGRYRLESVLGRGGMGTVWLAVDTLIDRRVALKEMRAPVGVVEGDEGSFVERALREARNAGRLNHPGVVGVHDVIAPDSDGGPVYLVMEYVPAPSLAEIIDEQGPLPAHRVAAIGGGILDALTAAHAMGIVHRDIKPANVLVAAGDRVKLTDFGIALAADDARLTRSGVIGTHAYLAPERFDTGEAGPAGDLWALGATLFHAVAGEAPFDRETTTATLRAILFEDPPPPPCGPPLADAIAGLLTRPVDQRLTSDAAQQMLQQAATAPAPEVPRAVAGQSAWDAQATTTTRPPAHPPTPQPWAQPTQPPAEAWGQPTQPGATPAAEPWGQPTQPAGPPGGQTTQQGGQPSPYVTAQPAPPLSSQGVSGDATYSSGGWGTATSAPGASWADAPSQRNNTPWLVGGALAIVALIALVAVLASGSDSDSDDGSSTAGPGAAEDGGGGAEAGYSDAMREQFISVCTGQAGGGAEAGSLCECAWNNVVQNVPFEEYQAFEAAFQEDPTTPLPAGVQDAVAACVD